MDISLVALVLRACQRRASLEASCAVFLALDCLLLSELSSIRYAFGISFLAISFHTEEMNASNRFSALLDNRSNARNSDGVKCSPGGGSGGAGRYRGVGRPARKECLRGEISSTSMTSSSTLTFPFNRMTNPVCCPDVPPVAPASSSVGAPVAADFRFDLSFRRSTLTTGSSTTGKSLRFLFFLASLAASFLRASSRRTLDMAAS